MAQGADEPVGFFDVTAQTDWFFKRSGGTVMRSPFLFNVGWFEAKRAGH